ncbi:MAG: Ni/Fe hydrogenase subunit alpha [Cyclobacteriaceae bacterium]|nr:Ni/Fe hydrogenase subunit alpha [Cyclobacteriaceae bacterium]
MIKNITIEPLTRVEGHGKVTLQVDEHGNISSSRLHIVEFRGFEKFIQGRPYWEAPVLVQRLCGICPVSHHLAAAKATDEIVGAGVEHLPETALKMRQLMHYGQFFQSHALHFFHLSSPDFLFGVDAPVSKRNVLGVAAEFSDLARQGIMMRKFGQEIIEATAGKKIHGTGAIPGGINKNLSPEQRKAFLHGDPEFNASRMIEWAEGAIEVFLNYHRDNRNFVDGFASFPSNHMSMVNEDGGLDIYHGRLRAVNAEGEKILKDIDYRDYLQYIGEEVRAWSYMKFPYLKSLGKEKGWYRVGPLARLNCCDYIPTPRAQEAFEKFREYTNGKPNNMSMHMHWARLIETLFAAEMIERLLQDDALSGETLSYQGTKKFEGIGVIEAPRGTLIHHYRIGDDDLITMANLIVSTTHNNQPMNEAVFRAAQATFNGRTIVTEGMLNAVEVAVRAYDPCLSCATHALGQMPLMVEIQDADGNILDTRIRELE